MTQALYSAKTGLSAGQTQVDVIANNVANINTTAYKTANVTFQTLFSSTLSSGSSAGSSSGGTNPKQIGMGTQVGSITRNFESGSVQTTGNAHNLMISGNGYFVVQSGNGSQCLTRDGSFSLDSSGNLVTTSGYKVVGTSSSLSTKGGTSTVQVPTFLNATVTGTGVSLLGSKTVSDLNNAAISSGKFTINVGTNTSTVSGTDFTDNGDGTFDYTGVVPTATYSPISSPNASDIASIKEQVGTYSSSTTYYTDGSNNYIVGTPASGSGTNTIYSPQATVSYDINSGDLKGDLNTLVDTINTAFSTSGYSGIQVKINPAGGGLILTNATGKTLSMPKDSQVSNFLTETGLSTAFEDGGMSTTQSIHTDTALTYTAGAPSTYDDGTTTYTEMTAPTATDITAIKAATGSYSETNTYYTDGSGNYVVGTGASATLPVYTAQPITAYEGSTVNETVEINNVVSYSDATQLKDYSIGEDGIITATYADGSQLTVKMGDDGTTTWQYVTSDNITINGNGGPTSDINTSNTTMDPSSMILELATVVNESGLISTTDNMWSVGANAGATYYGVANESAFGAIKTGALEGSNVDMTTELSNMITAQRAIQMNSRVFSTASSILQTIAQLGQ